MTLLNSFYYRIKVLHVQKGLKIRLYFNRMKFNVPYLFGSARIKKHAIKLPIRYDLKSNLTI